jgi:ABC-type multidrug transport system ATPase subunit/pSer/pThr/pTyr-binding forkhead associated (FHA) protein
MIAICPHCSAPQPRTGQKYCSRCGNEIVAKGALPAQPTTRAASKTVRADPAATGARLIVEDSGQLSDVPLAAVPITLGRAPHNQIVMVSRFVSANHARIEPNGLSHQIVDVGSTNGLLYQGQRLAANRPKLLLDGDIIRIGDPIGGSFVTLTYVNPAAAQIQQLPPIPLPGPGAPLLIGRGQAGAWENPQISRNHASIQYQVDGTHLLRDLGSTNGTYVNGQRITAHTLRQADVIQLGPFKLTYTGTALLQQAQRGGMRIEARALVVERPDDRATLLELASSRLRGAGLPRKRILQQVSLCIEPGEFVALVGGSGAGKSTLMGALSGFARATGGTVHVNGDDFYGNFGAYRPVLGYVPQDDIVHRMLPVERALDYAARLRLPDDTAASEIADRITRVLQDVEMGEHRATLVDHLSGGQRKRVSIGSELLADPSLFFLDEPTSGLDPGLEKKMMYTLRRLADGGRTVVLVTHATANIDRCDLVAFMSAGRLVYYGPPREAKLFFGVTSDDFADIYTRIDGRFNSADPVFANDTAMQQAYAGWQQIYPGSREQPWLAELWEARFRGSTYDRQYVQSRLGIAGAPARPAAPAAAASAAPALGSPLRQFRLLAQRYLELVVQDRRNLTILLLQAPFIAGLMALVIKSDALVGSGAIFSSARPVMFMLATIAVWFGIINAAREITKEAPIYQRERLANLRIIPYVLSKVMVLTGLVVIQSIMLLAIVGLKVHMPSAAIIASVGVELFVTTFLASLAGLALGLLISTVAATPDRAISIVPLALIPQIILSGVIFKLEGATSILSWLAIGRWAMDAYGSIADLNSLPQVSGGPPVSPAYDEYTHSAGHLWARWLIMLLYTAACLALTVWLLRRKDIKS